MKRSTRMLAALLLLACYADDDGYIIGPAQLGAATISAPDSAVVNTPVLVTVTVIGFLSEQCNMPAGRTVEHRGAAVRIQVLHQYPTGSVTCAAAPKAFSESVSLRFSTPGIRTIWLIGAARAGTGTRLDSISRQMVITR